MKKQKLSFCIALALSAQVSASEFTFTPSIETYLYKTQVESNNSSLTRDDMVFTTDLKLRAKYEKRHFTSNLDATLSTLQYSSFTESNDSYINISWQNHLTFLTENLKISGGIDRQRQLFNTIQGGFADRIYSANNAARLLMMNWSVDYALPDRYLLDSELRYVDTDRRVEYEDDVRQFGDFRVREATARIGHYQDSLGMYISINGSAREQLREDSSNFTNYQAEATIRTPFFSSLYSVINGNYSDYENDESEDFQFGNNVDSENSVAGFGLAWVQSHNGQFIQFTREYDFEDKEFNAAGQIRWALGERVFFDGTLTRQFYGKSSNYSMSYKGKHHSLSINYNEDVQLSYFLTAENFVEGVYICSPGNDEFTEFNLDICSLPTQLNTKLEPGQFLFTNIDTLFPVRERLIFKKRYGLDWQYQGAKWVHRFAIFDSKSDDLEFDNIQNNIEGLFDGSYQLNDTSYLSSEWRYRTTELNTIGVSISNRGTIDRLYGIAYNKEINTRAKFSIGLQHINRDDSEGEYSYDDNRIYFSYEHHFGSQNDSVRSLFPGRN